jgi:hypothetical protein
MVITAYLDTLHAKADATRTVQLATQRKLDALLPAVLDRGFVGSCETSPPSPLLKCISGEQL